MAPAVLRMMAPSPEPSRAMAKRQTPAASSALRTSGRESEIAPGWPVRISLAEQERREREQLAEDQGDQTDHGRLGGEHGEALRYGCEGRANLPGCVLAGEAEHPQDSDG